MFCGLSLRKMNYTFCVFVLVFLNVLNLGNALQCYKCDISVTNSVGDPCLSSQQLQDCAANSVCLSAPLSIQDGNIKQYTTTKSCTMANKDACQNYLNHKKQTSPGKVEFFGECYTCNETGCNRDSTKPPTPSAAPAITVPSIMMLPAMLFFTLYCFFSQLLVH